MSNRLDFRLRRLLQTVLPLLFRSYYRSLVTRARTPMIPFRTRHSVGPNLIVVPISDTRTCSCAPGQAIVTLITPHHCSQPRHWRLQSTIETQEQLARRVHVDPLMR